MWPSGCGTRGLKRRSLCKAGLTRGRPWSTPRCQGIRNNRLNVGKDRMGPTRKARWLLALVGGCGVARGQAVVPTASAADPNQFMRVAADAMSLTAAEVKPWHLRAKYQEFNLDGYSGPTGVLEAWWAGPEKFK